MEWNGTERGRMNMAVVLKPNTLLCPSPKQTLHHHHQHRHNAAPNSLKKLLLTNNFLSAKAANANANANATRSTGRFPPLAVKCLLLKEEEVAARVTEEAEAEAARVLPEEEEDAGVSRILWSDVVAKPAARSSRWTSVDVGTAVVVLSLHVLCLFAPFTFRWDALWTAVGLYSLTLLGITLSFHRNLSHHSFKLPKWLEYTFAYFGTQAVQGEPMDWVGNHRCHHRYCDTAKDPHTPTEGFWFSHLTWIFDSATSVRKCGEASHYVPDMEKQPFYRFMRNTYPLHPMALAALLYAVGGFPYLVWGMGVRIVCVYHAIWLLNSACHLWGYQTWKTKDLSRNNWLVGLLAFGEGWHNNHHAFEYSARHGLEWWEVDVTWYVVKLLQAICLATDVRLPSQLSMKRLSRDT